MSMKWVREQYKVPAKRGMTVRYRGQAGTILSAANGQIIVRMTPDSGHSYKIRLHPTDVLYEPDHLPQDGAGFEPAKPPPNQPYPISFAEAIRTAQEVAQQMQREADAALEAEARRHAPYEDDDMRKAYNRLLPATLALHVEYDNGVEGEIAHVQTDVLREALEAAEEMCEAWETCHPNPDGIIAARLRLVMEAREKASRKSRSEEG